MKAISSKIKLNGDDLVNLYQILLDGQWMQKTSKEWLEAPGDLKLIHSSLKQKIENKIKREKISYVLDLNVFEILYIQRMLQSLLPFLGLQAAEYQNYIFENRYDFNPYQIKQLKEIHTRIFKVYHSLDKLMEKIQSLNTYYEDHFETIMNMSLEERVNSYLQINEQLLLKKKKSGKVIPIHIQS